MGRSKISKELEARYERSAEDRSSDRREAKKRGMSIQEWEKSSMDRKMDRAAIRKKMK